LLNQIKNLIKDLNPDIIVQAPARINLINPLDAVEGDFWMPSVAINGIKNPLSVFVYIKKISSKSILLKYKYIQFQDKCDLELECQEDLIKNINHPLEFKNSEFKLIYGSIYRLFKTNLYYKKKFLMENIEIGILSTIPKQSGLGGSASIIVAFLYALSQYLGSPNKLSYLKSSSFPLNRDILAEMATKVEDEDLKITAGYSDRYIISRGGLCFISYVGKLHHRKLSSEPLAICDRIDKLYDIKQLPIIICYSGVLHESGSVHEKLRKLYLEKDDVLIKGYSELAEISWKSRFALMKHDWKLLGNLFQKNTEIMNKMMHHCGFKYGIGLANNFLIDLIKNNQNVYAVKLTGAGGGGSVFALVNPNAVDLVLNKWKRNLSNIIKDENTFKSKFPSFPSSLRVSLKQAKFYKISINKNGVQKL
jgi:galactokinase/mevalonate kinase-like predicted kinase